MFVPDLAPALAAALAARGYAEPTPVQRAVAAPEARGRDLLVSARTGSGKTVAYGLALGGDLLDEAGALPRAAAPLALVIAPTRELAAQVQRELQWLYAQAGARVVACVGGMDPRREARELQAGAHIVVGTPGRLRDHLERRQLDPSALHAVVLDEADEMLDLGFREELEFILEAAPAERRTLLFSATLPKPIQTLARRYQRDALRLEVGAGEAAHADIEYQALRTAPGETERALVNVLRFHEAGSAMVFCSTREGVKRTHAKLVERGFGAVALSGELTQNERNNALQALRDRRARVCVATDVAARGIDVSDLDLVVHADLPNDSETLQHRSGRTGRAGRKGTCVLLVQNSGRRRAEQLLRGARIEATWGPPPAADAIRGRDAQRLSEEVADAADAGEDELAAARTVLADHAPEKVALALVRLQRSRLPAPEELTELRDTAPGASLGPPGEGAGPRPGFEDTVWFRMALGRNKNADPRWLLPAICRRGGVTKREVGAIRILERETRFEVVRSAADAFAAAAAEAGPHEPAIEVLDDAGPMPPRDRRPPPRPHHRPGENAHAPKPYKKPGGKRRPN